MGPQFIHYESFQVSDGERPVAVGSTAGGLAGRIAHPSTHRAEGVGRGDGLQGSLVVLLPDVADVGGRIGSNGTRHLAGGRNEVRKGRIIVQVQRRGEGPTHGSAPERGCICDHTRLKGSSCRRYSGAYGRRVIRAASGVSATRSSRSNSRKSW